SQAGGDVDHLAATPGDHRRSEGGAGMYDAVKVDGADPAPVVDRHVGEAARHADPGVVDEDVDRPGTGGEGGHGVGVGHVAALGPAGSPGFAAQRGRLLGGLEI